MKITSRTRKYRDLRNELDSDKQAYFEHIKKLEEEKIIKEQQRQIELQRQAEQKKKEEEELQRQTILEQQRKLEQERLEKEEKLKAEKLEKQRIKEEKRQIRHNKINSAMNYVLIIVFVSIMIVSTIMWKKGSDNNEFNRVIGNDLTLYKYDYSVKGYLNINKSKKQLIAESDFNENDIAALYIKVVNKSEDSKRCTALLKIEDPNSEANNYEYGILMNGVIDNDDLEENDYEYIKTICDYKGNLSELTNLNPSTSFPLIKDSIINGKNDNTLNFILYIHKIDSSIKDNINIDISIISK